jgi:hypothetical protein
MALYTVVDDGYCVNVYTTKTALVKFIEREKLCIEPECEDGVFPNIYQIRKFVREIDYVGYLYEGDSSSWKYRIEIQNSVNY